jgi:hypothetical protein
MEGEITWRIEGYFEFLAKANASLPEASLPVPELAANEHRNLRGVTDIRLERLGAPRQLAG